GILAFGANAFVSSSPIPLDGQGLNPLLQSPFMNIHPVLLYLGFTGFSVPFAFAVSALVSGRLDSSWFTSTRRWTVLAWAFLSVGIVLGAAWAYMELGWGGYWAWDPVENASLLPWLTATAFLHSVMIQERRGMLYPVVVEAVTGQQVSVGPPYFNAVVVPLGLALLGLMGIGPLVAWRRASTRGLQRAFTLPLAAGVVTIVALFAAGVRSTGA